MEPVFRIRNATVIEARKLKRGVQLVIPCAEPARPNGAIHLFYWEPDAAALLGLARQHGRIGGHGRLAVNQDSQGQRRYAHRLATWRPSDNPRDAPMTVARTFTLRGWLHRVERRTAAVDVCIREARLSRLARPENHWLRMTPPMAAAFLNRADQWPDARFQFDGAWTLAYRKGRSWLNCTVKTWRRSPLQSSLTPIEPLKELDEDWFTPEIADRDHPNARLAEGWRDPRGLEPERRSLPKEPDPDGDDQPLLTARAKRPAKRPQASFT